MSMQPHSTHCLTFSRLLCVSCARVRVWLPGIEAIIAEHGVFLVQGQDGDMAPWIHEGTLSYLGLQRQPLRGKPSFAGGIQGWRKGSEAARAVLPKLLQCAMDAACNSPPGSSLGNHRYDQSALSAVVHSWRDREGRAVPGHTELLSNNRHSELQGDCHEASSRVIYTARGGSQEYVGDLVVLER